MSPIPLSNLSLPKVLLEKLHQNSIFQVEDLISKAPMELVKLLNSPLSQIEYLYKICFQNLPVEPINIFDLIQKQNEIQSNSNLDIFDKLIFENEILKKGFLSEICGPPGVGKTQFLFQLCSSNFLNKPDSSIIYIDTENNFNPERLVQIAKEKFLYRDKTEDDLTNMTKNIFVYQKFNFSEFDELMKFIEFEIIVKKTSLLIIDSLASIVRREFSGSDPSVLYERSLFLSKISSRLKAIAEFLDVAVIVINQIITISNKPLNNPEFTLKAVETENSTVIPALGNSWTHYVNIRLVLQYVDDERRELLLVKSPVSPFRRYIYTINSEDGFLIEDFEQSSESINPNDLKIRSKPYSK
ncbi:unnamed protein product [Brachionus calyciflorus]|uniref:RecA family profile 1 domain-containing protein n=1 Tax=Brachionus calyciflorus TaxID=104777 RepID=A0A813PTL7_9BILA|nr:unnamed protein product [Brachionus calyciflorus]